MTQSLLSVATIGLPESTNTYYLNVLALTPKINAQTNSNESVEILPSVSSFFVWAPQVLFIVLFIAIFGMMLVNKVMNWKRAIGTFVLALALAGIPYVVTSLNGNVSTQLRAGPEELPRTIEIVRNTNASAVVSWTTDKEAVGAIRYSVKPLDIDLSRVMVANAGQKTSKHSVSISGLQVGKTYEMEVYSGTQWYNNDGVPLEFTVE